MSNIPLTKIASALFSPLEAKPAKITQKLKKINGIKAVVFDTYGTLLMTQNRNKTIPEPSVDYDESIVDALEWADFDIFDTNEKFSDIYVEHLQAHYNIRMEEGIEYPDVNICDVWQDYLSELFSKGVIDGYITERSIKRLIMRHECSVTSVWPQKSALPCIRTLQDAGITLGTLSTAQFYTPIIMEALFQNSLETLGFKKSICIWSYEHQHRKPSSEIFNICTKRLSDVEIEPNETLYIGNDVLTDIVPAAKCGFKTALFSGDDRSLRLHTDDDECKSTKPDIIFSDFSKIVDCIA